MNPTWTGTAAAALAGCPYSNVDAWDTAGVVRPSTPASGPGSRRQYTFQDLIGLSLAAAVLRIGVPRLVTKKLVAHVAERRGCKTATSALRSAGIWILSDGKTAWEIREGQPIGRLRTSLPVAVYAVPLRPIVETLCARIADSQSVRPPARRRAQA